jgi:hypothetical protein
VASKRVPLLLNIYITMATGTVDNSKLTFQINRSFLLWEQRKIMHWGITAQTCILEGEKS